MGRRAIGRAQRGSQYWLQLLCNERERFFLSALQAAAVLPKGVSVRWVSPKRDDDFAEYSDSRFLQQLGLREASKRLGSFWPRGGPWWDGLGVTTDDRYLLIEAKAHIGEMVSTPTGAKSKRSLQLIRKSLNETKEFLGAKPEIDWSTSFYQYGNRLAHLYWLRECEHLEAELIFACFTGDRDMGGPSSSAEWSAAIELLERFLGVTRHKLAKHVHHVFPDVRKLRQTSN